MTFRFRLTFTNVPRLDCVSPRGDECGTRFADATCTSVEVEFTDAVDYRDIRRSARAVA